MRTVTNRSDELKSSYVVLCYLQPNIPLCFSCVGVDCGELLLLFAPLCPNEEISALDSTVFICLSVYCEGVSLILWQRHTRTHSDPSTSIAFIKLLFAFSQLLVSALLASPLISVIYFYLLFLLFFSSTVAERSVGIHSNVFACVYVCV